MICKRTFPPADRLEHFYGKVELGADGAPTERWRKRTVTFVRTPWPFRLTWAPQVTVHRLPCHRQVTGPLQDALAAIAEEFPREEILAAGLDLFGGSRFFALDVGSRADAEKAESFLRLSPHLWGAAFVFPGLNGKGKANARALALFLEAGWDWDPERCRVAAMVSHRLEACATLEAAAAPAASAASSLQPPAKIKRR